MNKIFLSIFTLLFSQQNYSFVYLAEVLKTTYKGEDHFIYFLSDRHIDDKVPFFDLNLVNELNLNDLLSAKNLYSRNAMQSFELFKEIKKRFNALLILEDMIENEQKSMKILNQDVNKGLDSQVHSSFLCKTGEICKSEIEVINVEFRFIYGFLRIIEEQETLKIFFEKKVKLIKDILKTTKGISKTVQELRKNYLNEIEELEIQIKELQEKEKFNLQLRKIIFKDLISKIEEIINYNDNSELNLYYNQELINELKRLDNINYLNHTYQSIFNIICKIIDFRIVNQIYKNQFRKHIFVCAGGWHIENVSKVLKEKLGYQSIKMQKKEFDISVDIKEFFKEFSIETKTANEKLISKL